MDALLAVAGALDLPEKAESGLIGIPESTNGRGLREVGCLPGIGPGLADAAAPGELDGRGGAAARGRRPGARGGARARPTP